MTTPTQRPASNSEGRKRAQEKAEVVHHAPILGSGGITPCCGVTPFELPRTDRLTVEDALVTCSGPPTPAEPEAAPSMAEVLLEHQPSFQTDGDYGERQWVECTCGSEYFVDTDAGYEEHVRHQAQALTAAGFGHVASVEAERDGNASAARALIRGRAELARRLTAAEARIAAARALADEWMAHSNEVSKFIDADHAADLRAALDGEATPPEPDADEQEGCPSCDRDLSAPGVSGHECYTYAERAARIASRTPDAHLAAAKAEKVARGMERLRAVNPMNGDSSNYMLDRAQRVLVEEFPECRAAIEDERRVAASEREELYERLERENAARAARLREQGGDA